MARGAKNARQEDRFLNEIISLLVLISLLAYYCYKNLNFVTASLLLLSSTLIFAVLCTYLYDVYNNLIMGISSFVSNKGNISSAMFGFVNTFLSPLDFSSFENMFFIKRNGKRSKKCKTGG